MYLMDDPIMGFCFVTFYRPITLVLAKCWDPNPKGYFMSPRQEPVRPMDPSTWVSETTRGMWNRGGAQSMSSMTSATSSIISSLPRNECKYLFRVEIHKVCQFM